MTLVIISSYRKYMKGQVRITVVKTFSGVTYMYLQNKHIFLSEEITVSMHSFL